MSAFSIPSTTLVKSASSLFFVTTFSSASLFFGVTVAFIPSVGIITASFTILVFGATSLSFCNFKAEEISKAPVFASNGVVSLRRCLIEPKTVGGLAGANVSEGLISLLIIIFGSILTYVCADVFCGVICVTFCIEFGNGAVFKTGFDTMF